MYVSIFIVLLHLLSITIITIIFIYTITKFTITLACVNSNAIITTTELAFDL